MTDRNDHTDHTDHALPPQSPGQPVLSPADARAVDALFEAGLDLAKTDPGVERARVRRAWSILNLLEVRSKRDSALVDATLARVMQTQGAGVGTPDGAMGFEDEAALDAWVMNGFNAERVPGSLRERARRHERLAAMVTQVDGVGGSAESLVERTLSRVQQSIDTDQTRTRIETEPMPPWSGILLADPLP